MISIWTQLRPFFDNNKLFDYHYHKFCQLQVNSSPFSAVFRYGNDYYNVFSRIQQKTSCCSFDISAWSRKFIFAFIIITSLSLLLLNWIAHHADNVLSNFVTLNTFALFQYPVDLKLDRFNKRVSSLASIFSFANLGQYFTYFIHQHVELPESSH